MKSDAERWDARHAAADPATARPPEAIADDSMLIAAVPQHGRALDVACGTGAQTLWLAERGLVVTALDVSTVAVDLLRGEASATGLSASIDVRRVDLDEGLPTDLGTFDVILCQRFRQPDLYASLVSALRPGGLGIVTVLSEVGAESPGPFHAPPGELGHAFDTAGVDVIRATEAGGVASVVFRRH